MAWPTSYEVTTAYSNPNIVDFTTNVVVAIVTNGASATVVLGDWEDTGTRSSPRATAENSCIGSRPPPPGSTCWRSKGTQFEENGGASFELSLDADGRSVGVTRLVAPHGVNGKAWFFLPHLDGSEHVFNLAWRYQLGGGSLRVVALRLLELGGPDTNSNGVADWIDHRHQNMLGATAIPAQSWYSPVCVEGQAGGVSALSVASSYAASNVPPPVVRAGVVNNWHADVHLDPVQDTEVTVHANMGSLSFTSVVTWVPLNVLQADTNAFMVRRGSTVRLTAYPEGDSNGVVGITVVGVTNVETTAGQPVDVTFAYDGVYTVTGAYVGVVSTSRVVLARHGRQLHQ
jgi:hypothetical protein